MCAVDDISKKGKRRTAWLPAHLCTCKQTGVSFIDPAAVFLSSGTASLSLYEKWFEPDRFKIRVQVPLRCQSVADGKDALRERVIDQAIAAPHCSIPVSRALLFAFWQASLYEFTPVPL